MAITKIVQDGVGNVTSITVANTTANTVITPGSITINGLPAGSVDDVNTVLSIRIFR